MVKASLVQAMLDQAMRILINASFDQAIARMAWSGHGSIETGQLDPIYDHAGVTITILPNNYNTILRYCYNIANSIQYCEIQYLCRTSYAMYFRVHSGLHCDDRVRSMPFSIVPSLDQAIRHNIRSTEYRSTEYRSINWISTEYRLNIARISTASNNKRRWFGIACYHF